METIYQNFGENKLSTTLENSINVLKFVKDWGVRVYREPDTVVLYVRFCKGLGTT
jgi:hypothetical protein